MPGRAASLREVARRYRSTDRKDANYAVDNSLRLVLAAPAWVIAANMASERQQPREVRRTPLGKVRGHN